MNERDGVGKQGVGKQGCDPLAELLAWALGEPLYYDGVAENCVFCNAELTWGKKHKPDCLYLQLKGLSADESTEHHQLPPAFCPKHMVGYDIMIGCPACSMTPDEPCTFPKNSLGFSMVRAHDCSEHGQGN